MKHHQLKAMALFMCMAIMAGCNHNAPKTVAYPEWAKNSVIYEVNIRQYSPDGTFKAFEKDLPRIKNLGIDIIWIMPIHPIGIEKRKFPDGSKTSLGSYYSVKDYKGINPEYGTMEDFGSLVTKAHEMGLKVIIDWVANHTAWDNQWVTDHTDWYKKDSSGKIISPFDWTDVAQLDYSNKGLRKEMIEAMSFWLTKFDIDGFRCDVAGEVPKDFWEDARNELQKTKPLYMLAENEDKPGLCDVAFDSNYGWDMHGTMKDVAQGKQKIGAVLKLQQRIDSSFPKRAFKLNFITNHDENSWNGTAKEKFGDFEKNCAVLTYALPGMPLIYNGQEANLTKRLRFFAKDTISWNDTTMFSFYRTLNGLKHRNQAIWNQPYGGKIEQLTTNAPEKVISFLRSSEKSKVMVLLNMGTDSLNVDITSDIADGKYVNIFDNNEISLSSDNRKCKLLPNGYLVLEGK